MVWKFKIGRSRIYDVLHKTSVSICVALTGLLILGLVSDFVIMTTQQKLNKMKHKNAIVQAEDLEELNQSEELQ